MLAAMVRTVWLYENRPEFNWSGGAAAVSNHQIVQTLERHPELRDHVGLGEQVAAATGMIKSAAGAGSYLVANANRRADLEPWYDGVIDGAGLARHGPRLLFRRDRTAGMICPQAARRSSTNRRVSSASQSASPAVTMTSASSAVMW